MEFALAWPVLLLVVFGSIQVAVWGSEQHAAASAALAGARAGSAADSSADAASAVTLAALRPSLIGATVAPWCGGPRRPAGVWVCARVDERSARVQVGGDVPALVPLPGPRGLPLSADVSIARERFAP